MANFLFEELKWKVQDGFPRCGNLNKELEHAEYELECLRRHFEIICNFVDKLNENFGLILLINLAWIFYTSLCTFSDMLISYAFIIIVSARFDLKQMSFDMRIVEMTHGRISLHQTSAPYLVNDSHLTSDFINLCYTFQVNSLVSMVRSIFVFVTIWIRLLTIVVSSVRLRKQVNVILKKKITFCGYNFLMFYQGTRLN